MKPLSEEIKLKIGLFQKEIEREGSWVQRKEISAWTALVFYLAFLWALFNFLLKEDIVKNSIEIYFLPIILVLLAFLFFIFIHAQYSSIYHSMAYSRTLKKIILKLLNGDGSDLDFTWEKDREQPNCIEERLKIEREFIQKDCNNRYPITLLKDFWSLDWLFRPNVSVDSKRKLYPRERMEAAIYSLVIFVNLLMLEQYILFYFIQLWSHINHL